MSVPRYLWPADKQRSGYPFRDGEIQAACDRACERTKHLTLSEVLRMDPDDLKKLVEGDKQP